MGAVSTPEAAAIYCRISADRNGDGLGVARQEELCRKLATEKGWSVAEVYIDNDRSAYNGAPRPAYERMLADLEAGRRDAVLCVDLDRLTRRPAELEEFMELADRAGVALANVSGDTDLASSDGRFKARIMGAVARQESEKKAERVSREAEQAARRGVPRGSRRPFGWEEDKRTLRPAEAALIREAVERVLAGESVPTIAREWNARGIPTPQRAKHGWSASTVMGILRNPRLAGLRAYKGEIVAEGQWEAIIDRGTWEALQSRVKRVARPGRPSTHLLSGIARCGRCDGPLWTSWRKNKRGVRAPRYACVARPGAPGCGRLTVTGGPLDELVRNVVIAALSGPALAEAREAHQQDDQETREAARTLTEAEDRLEHLAADYADGTISRREWMAARERLQERIAEARRLLDRHSGPTADLPADQDAIRETWETETMEWQRALIQAVLDRIVVNPSPPSPTFNPERVEFTWRA